MIPLAFGGSCKLYSQMRFNETVCPVHMQQRTHDLVAVMQLALSDLTYCKEF